MLYHGSKALVDEIGKRQAMSNGDVPHDEVLNGIYLTPDLGFAVAMAARPENSSTTIDDRAHKITFEKPELFDPEKEIFIYGFDTDDIPKENLRFVDELQYVVLGKESLIPKTVEREKAEKILEFYELTNWEGDESRNEMRGEMRLH